MKRTGILRPGLLATIVLTALVMLGAGWAGAFAGARLSLDHAPDLPSGAEARQLSATAFPGLRVFGGGNAPAIEPYEDGEGVKYGSVSYWVKHTEQTRDVAAYTASARDRLAAAGWQVHDYQVEPPEDLIDGGASYRATFWATKPGLMLAFADDYWTGRPSYDSTGAASFDLWRTPPAFMDDAAVAGAAAGALLALLLSVWVTRRLRSVPARRATVGGWTVVGLVMLLPTLMTPGEEYPMQSPWFAGFYYFGLLPGPEIRPRMPE